MGFELRQTGPLVLFSNNTLPPSPPKRAWCQDPAARDQKPSVTGRLPGSAAEGGAGRGGAGASQGRKRRSPSRLHPRPRSSASRRHE